MAQFQLEKDKIVSLDIIDAQTWKGSVCDLRNTQALISLRIIAGWPGPSLPLTVSVDIVLYVDEERMSRSDCIYAHGHLGIHCSHMA